MNLRYELIDNKNIILATRVQLKIFPGEIAYPCYKMSIEDHEHYKYYLVYNNDVIIGVTGLYTECDYKDDSIWLGWYGVLKEYRLHGFGKQILLDTIEMAKEEVKNNPRIKYLRLYTSLEENKVAQILYKKYMEISEYYENDDDINYDHTCLIYTKRLNENVHLELWNSRFINLRAGSESMSEGLKEFMEITNGDINVQISPAGEVF